MADGVFITRKQAEVAFEIARYDAADREFVITRYFKALGFPPPEAPITITKEQLHAVLIRLSGTSATPDDAWQELKKTTLKENK